MAIPSAREGARRWTTPPWMLSCAPDGFLCQVDTQRVVTSRRIWGEGACSPQQAGRQLAAWAASTSERSGCQDAYLALRAGCPLQRLVNGDERAAERFCQCHVRGVVGGHVGSQAIDPG